MVYAQLISVCSRYCIQYYDWLLTSSDEVHFFVYLLLPFTDHKCGRRSPEVAGLALVSG